ncbi:hypothetical protein [Yoonia sp. 2307UL14-13]|uniref:hypothetical protein n=1 Tax=Yoonia sp. 2307UL14-13 TaxID=3126506 RepID=UPI00309E8836
MFGRLITAASFATALPAVTQAQCTISVPGTACIKSSDEQSLAALSTPVEAPTPEVTPEPAAAPTPTSAATSIAAPGCRNAIAGTVCVAVPQKPRPAPVAVGDMLERGQYSMLMNARYYGLPSAGDGWVYMQIEREIYRVDWRTHEVLEQVTHKASRNWRRW